MINCVLINYRDLLDDIEGQGFFEIENSCSVAFSFLTG